MPPLIKGLPLPASATNEELEAKNAKQKGDFVQLAPHLHAYQRPGERDDGSRLCLPALPPRKGANALLVRAISGGWESGTGGHAFSSPFKVPRSGH